MNTKRNISTFFGFAFILIMVYPQKPRVKRLPALDDEPLYFGFNFGFNTMDFGFGQNTAISGNETSVFPDLYRLQLGFNVGVVTNIRLCKYLDLRIMPGIAFNERHIYFINILNESPEFGLQKINSSFADLPILIKYGAERINNMKPYFVFGENTRFDLASKRDYDEADVEIIRLKQLDYYIETGIGCDFYLEYFRFSTEIKYSYGLRDVLAGDDHVGNREFVSSIDFLNSRMIFLTFYFEGGHF